MKFFKAYIYTDNFYKHLLNLLLLEILFLLSYFIRQVWFMPVMLLLLLCMIFLTIKFPETVFIAFIFIGISKGWIEENIPFFKSVDYTLFIFMYLTFLLLIKYLTQKKHFISIEHIILPLFLLSMTLFIGLIYTPEFDYGFQKASRFFLFNFMLFVYTIIYIQSLKDVYRLIITLIMFSLFFAFLMFGEGVQLILHSNLFQSIRMRVLGANPIASARIFSVALLSLIVFLYFEQIKWKKIVLSFLTLIIFVALIVTNSRGPVLASILTLFFFLYYFSGAKKSRIFIYFLIIAIFSGLVLYFLPEQFTNRYFLLIRQESEFISPFVGRVDTAQIRLKLWNMAIENYFSSMQSILIGEGTGAFQKFSILESGRMFPHNIFLEILYETGLIGFIFFSTHLKQIYQIIKESWQRVYKYFEQKILFIAVLMPTITAFLSTFVSGDLTDNRYLWFFGGMIVGFWRVIKTEDISSSEQSERIQKFIE